MTNPRRPSQQLLLDAAEHVLLEDGAQALTTRRVAARAGVPNGLVHYHLGSVDAMLRALTERVGSRLVSHHRALFQAPEPFAERWRSAVAATAGDPTWAAWTRLRALSLSRPGMEVTVAVIDREWRGVLAGGAARGPGGAGGPAGRGGAGRPRQPPPRR